MSTAITARITALEIARRSEDPQIRATVRKFGPTGPANRQCLRATLREALNDGSLDAPLRAC